MWTTILVAIKIGTETVVSFEFLSVWYFLCVSIMKLYLLLINILIGVQVISCMEDAGDSNRRGKCEKYKKIFWILYVFLWANFCVVKYSL